MGSTLELTIHHYDRFASDEDDVAVERSQPALFRGVPFYIEACFVPDAPKGRLLECSLVCDFGDEAACRFSYNVAALFRLERPDDPLRMKAPSKIVCNTFAEHCCRLSYQWPEVCRALVTRRYRNALGGCHLHR